MKSMWDSIFNVKWYRFRYEANHPIRWVRDRLGLSVRVLTHVNVREFYAKGNGVKNDAAAIQAAINKMADEGGGAVHFPAGVYEWGREMVNGLPAFNSRARVIRKARNEALEEAADVAMTIGHGYATSIQDSIAVAIRKLKDAT